MEIVYHGEVPKSEVALLRKWVAAVCGEEKPIYWHDFIDAVRYATELVTAPGKWRETSDVCR
jgi:hypothetical protein